jgi:hypothetical protein
VDDAAYKDYAAMVSRAVNDAVDQVPKIGGVTEVWFAAAIVVTVEGSASQGMFLVSSIPSKQLAHCFSKAAAAAATANDGSYVKVDRAS